MAGDLVALFDRLKRGHRLAAGVGGVFAARRKLAAFGEFGRVRHRAGDDLQAHVRIGVQPGMLVRKKSKNPIFVSGLTIENRGGKQLVELGILSKKMQKQAGIDTTVFYAELNWTALMKVIRKQKVEFTDIPKYPAVSRDLALLIDKNVEFAQIEEIARQTEKKLLKKVELFDVYEGDKLPQGKKSYAVNFILQDAEKTMGDKQIEAIMNKLITSLKQKLGAELR